MKVLIITGSHSPKQTSYGIAYKLLRKLRRREGVTAEILELAEQKIDNCCATAKCSKTPEKRCLNGDDDFNGIFDKMAENDAVFFIVPKYAPYPSRFIALLERLVAVAWWGFYANYQMSEFALNKKSLGVITFANSPVTNKEIFEPLYESFNSIGFDLLSLNDGQKGLFINRSKDNEDQLLEEASQVLFMDFESRIAE